MLPAPLSDQTQFLRLYLANDSSIRAFLHSLVRDRRDFDDVYQTVVLRLLEKFDTYDPQRPFGPWARGVAAKEILAFRRHQGRCPTPFSPEVVAHILDSFETRLASRPADREEALSECLKVLPEESRELLALRYRDSLSMTKIAEQVGRTATATQRAISRIRAQLGDCVERRLTTLEAQ